jgi:uncharacterized protein
MRIWIDLSNSPHVLFFVPVIRELEKRGHSLFLTYRDFAQTSSLCELYNLDSKCIGQHGGKGIWRKIKNISGRALALRNFARKLKIDLAVSHNSYAHCLAAKSLGIRYITIMDYEHQPANHINFRLSDIILTPFTFQLQEVSKFGATQKKLIKYPGLKEEVYLWNFEKDIDFWSKEYPELENTKKVMCVIRPPATMAAYHNFENPFFNKLTAHLLANPDIQPVFFPRTNEQGIEYKKKFPNLYISNKSVDGVQLVANADLVISAGGTMNREAAVLGTPAYTVYAGKMGSVDRYLMKEGKIKLIRGADEIRKIRIEKKKNCDIVVYKKTFDYIIDVIA